MGRKVWWGYSELDLVVCGRTASSMSNEEGPFRGDCDSEGHLIASGLGEVHAVLFQSLLLSVVNSIVIAYSAGEHVGVRYTITEASIGK